MDEKFENRINCIGAKIDIIESINNALISSLTGTDCLTQKDACAFAYLLENRINDLKTKQDKLIKDLNI